MKQFYEIIVVIPVGPDTRPEFLADTIESFMHYTISSYKVIIIDDSHQGIGMIVQKSYPHTDVLHTERISGSMTGLYITLSVAYSYVLKKYDFNLLLKLDTDALVIGPHPEADALKLFASNSRMGIAGQYPCEYNGNSWDVEWPRTRILNA